MSETATTAAPPATATPPPSPVEALGQAIDAEAKQAQEDRQAQQRQEQRAAEKQGDDAKAAELERRAAAAIGEPGAGDGGEPEGAPAPAPSDPNDRIARLERELESYKAGEQSRERQRAGEDARERFLREEFTDVPDLARAMLPVTTNPREMAQAGMKLAKMLDRYVEDRMQHAVKSAMAPGGTRTIRVGGKNWVMAPDFGGAMRDGGITPNGRGSDGDPVAGPRTAADPAAQLASALEPPAFSPRQRA